MGSKSSVYLVSLALLFAGCQDEGLSQQVGQLEVTAEPSAGQVRLNEPLGIHYGEVPIYGSADAKFTIRNVSGVNVLVERVELETSTDGLFTTTLISNNETLSAPFEIGPKGTETALTSLSVRHSANGQDGDIESATLKLYTTAGTSGADVIELRLEATALFVGQPNLELQYQSNTYKLPEDCSSITAEGVCELAPLAFGNVALGSATSTNLLLRNIPAAGTCSLPPLADGGSDCSPVCAVTFDKDPANQDLGLGFVPSDVGFSLSGSANVPFVVAPEEPNCSNEGNMVRGELKLVINFQAAETTGTANSTLYLESNDPDAPRIAIPLVASSQEGPEAKATLRLCDDQNPPPACVQDAAAIRPLSRVYFDGSGSSDPNGEDLVAYEWEVVEYPDGAGPENGLYAPTGADSPQYSIFVPLAGEYVVRLRVTNQSGVTSGISAESDVSFTALPDSRLHLQLVWDHPQNDQDLHLVRVNDEGAALIYHSDYDCYWSNCKPSCGQGGNDDCTPVQWFGTEDPFTGPNPSLDIDDQNGLGPENINVDEPAPGKYRVYVYYYGLTDPTSYPTDVTVRLYIDGILRQQSRANLERNDLWAVMEIDWKEDDTATISIPEPDAQSIVELNSIPQNNIGHVFTPDPF